MSSETKEPIAQEILFEQIDWLRALSKALMLKRDDAPGGGDSWAGKLTTLASTMIREAADTLDDRLAEEIAEENSNKEMRREHG